MSLPNLGSIKLISQFYSVFNHFDCVCFVCFSLSGRRGVTLGKPDIKVETVNKETHSLEEETPDASTATRMVKAMYSVSRHPSESPGAAHRRRTGHWP